MKVIEPGQHTEITKETKVIFLAGPIQGADNWQAKVIEMFKTKFQEPNSVVIANPRSTIAPNFWDDSIIDWETKYLNLASKTGVILFWMAPEVKYYCDRSFAQTTRFEFAEWLTKAQYNEDIRLAVGIDPEYTGQRYIKHRMGDMTNMFPILTSLESTVEETIKIIQNENKQR